ncbi:hypothetical protein BCR36DRAFT_587449 [Piromyces finnis]|uniref:ER membrane protein complex subunit 6 n=1 Tax=Piromyces finnis TaxID=1754191 RepID=A0A1Y1UVR2_9FUNG|nr:hypothetical protein BCR36DRAFT_587449 [Piromyces finnis]|eukprot:ORX42149.1 hypothetical protein BCR36DRAFT_587449 [Piromyces finnis]
MEGSKFEKLNIQAIVENNQKAQTIRIVMSIFGGLAAGVLGITGFNGFYFYIGLNVIILIALLMKSKFQITKYFNGKMDILCGDLFSNLLCYIMFWCLGYALINVYE